MNFRGKKLEQVLLIISFVILGLLVWALFGYRTVNEDLVSAIVASDAQISRAHQRLDDAPENRDFVLDSALFWRPIDGRSGEQLMQTWLLTEARKHGQTIRQYQQLQQNSAISGPNTGFRLEFSGALSGLVSFINQIEMHRPALGMTNLQIRSLPEHEQQDGATQVSSQISVWGLINDSPH